MPQKGIIIFTVQNVSYNTADVVASNYVRSAVSGGTKVRAHGSGPLPPYLELWLANGQHIVVIDPMLIIRLNKVL